MATSAKFGGSMARCGALCDKGIKIYWQGTKYNSFSFVVFKVKDRLFELDRRI